MSEKGEIDGWRGRGYMRGLIVDGEGLSTVRPWSDRHRRLIAGEDRVGAKGGSG